jgi:hypothetical protein
MFQEVFDTLDASVTECIVNILQMYACVYVHRYTYTDIHPYVHTHIYLHSIC